MLSTKVLPCFSEHVDSREKYSASKINGQCEDSDYEDNIPLKVLREQKNATTSQVTSRNNCNDSTSDDSDYGDDIPLKIVQEGLNIMSDKSPISGRTRITKGHDFSHDMIGLN